MKYEHRKHRNLIDLHCMDNIYFKFHGKRIYKYMTVNIDNFLLHLGGER